MDKRIVLRAVEEKVRSALLDKAGISVCEYVPYLNYTREIWSKFDKYSGSSLKRALTEIKAKWEWCGLNPTLLQAIWDFIEKGV